MYKYHSLIIILICSIFASTYTSGQPSSQAGQTIRIRAVGDIMLGASTPEGYLRPENKGSILKYITPHLRDADITMGNLEGSLCDTGVTTKCEEDSADCYVFRMPERYGGDLKAAGFDFLSLANNHIVDFGTPCRDRTEQILDSLSILWSGRAGSSANMMIGNESVAFIAFHSAYHTNNLLNIQEAADQVQKLAGLHDIVLVSLHGGAEGRLAMTLPDSMETYFGESRGHLVKLARALVDAGADFVFGHGPHIARAMEVYKGKLIAYSLGNFATYGRFNLQEERRFGAILEVELSPEGQLQAARIISVEQKYWGVPLIDSQHRFAHLVDSLSVADRASAAARFDSLGYLQFVP